MPELAPIAPNRRLAYAVINTCTALIWLAMIFAPTSKVTAWLVRRSTALFLALGGAYDVLLVSGMVREGKVINFSDPDAVRTALTNPDTFLAGWAHYIAFDLFVGRWVWEDSLERGERAPISLLLTWLAGPAGLSIYLAKRG